MTHTLADDSTIHLLSYSELMIDLPGGIRSRMNVKLGRSQGGHCHAQETVYARRDYSISADG